MTLRQRYKGVFAATALAAVALIAPVAIRTAVAQEPTTPGAVPAPGLGSVKDAVKKEAQGATEAVKDAVGKAVAPAPAVVDPTVGEADRVAALRRKVLKEEDFMENDETNRDPFRDFTDFLRGVVKQNPEQKVGPPAIFETFNLEELSLIAIVSGDANPRAMFRDPKGLGISIKRGDLLSRMRARVTKILSDRVVVEVSEAAANGPPKIIERAVLIRPDEVER